MEVIADPQAQVASPERMEPQDPLQRRQSVLFGEEKSFSPLPGLQHRKSEFSSWIKIDQLDVTCFIISLFTAQHVSNVSTSIFSIFRPIVDLFHVLYCSGSMCVGVMVWFGWGGVVSICRLKQLLNMFRMLVHPSSVACDLLWIYFMCCIALVRCVLVLRCG